MRAEGLEPPRPNGHEDLNLARLPVPPRPLAPHRIVARDLAGLYGRPLMAEESTVVIDHPNREKASSKATKAVVLLLLLVSVALMLIVIIGGWSVLQGAKPVTIGYVAVYL